MNLPDIQLLQTFTDLQKKYASLKDQHTKILEEIKEIKHTQNQDLSSQSQRIEQNFKSELDLEKIKTDLDLLREDEELLRKNLISSAVSAFDDFLATGKYKDFIDLQISKCQKEYGSTLVLVSKNTESLVSKHDKILDSADQIRVEVMNGKITFIFDPKIIRQKVVENLLPTAFVS